jgi:hypothetical protein
MNSMVLASIIKTFEKILFKKTNQQHIDFPSILNSFQKQTNKWINKPLRKLNENPTIWKHVKKICARTLI